MGSEERRQDRRPRRLRALLQPDEHAVELSEIQNFRQLNAIIANPTYPDPYGGRDPFSFVSTGVQNIAVEANDLENLQSAAYTGGVSRQLGARRSPSTSTASTTR